jgi:hypothetical protein
LKIEKWKTRDLDSKRKFSRMEKDIAYPKKYTGSELENAPDAPGAYKRNNEPSLVAAKFLE